MRDLTKALVKILISVSLLWLTFVSAASTTQYPAEFAINLQSGFGGIDTPATNTTDPVTGIHIHDQHLQQGMSWRVSTSYLFTATPVFKWGPEFGYAQVPDNSYQLTGGEVGTAKWSSVYFDFALAAHLVVVQNYSIICKVGLVDILQKTSLNIAGQNNITNQDAMMAPEFVLGLGYQFTPQINLNLTYNEMVANEIDPTINAVTNIQDGQDLGNVAKLTTYLFGISYLF